MRTRHALLPIALFVTSGSLAALQGDEPGPWYLGFGAGLNSVDANQGFEPDEGFAWYGSLGYRLTPAGEGRLSLALEAEYFYSENDLEEGDFPISFGLTGDDLQTSVVFGNLVGDWYWTDAVSLYLGGGIGWAETVELFDAEEDGVAWQGKAGLRFELGGGFSWNIGYRYLMTEDVADADDFENTQQVGEMGVRWAL